MKGGEQQLNIADQLAKYSVIFLVTLQENCPQKMLIWGYPLL